ncbi:DUF550 domain-containing protein [Salmonella enterica]|nr:DUF550 domain-containing protein [Salmonella enterica]EFQ4755706.1 DUF550 domain-containing protein [Salmonella enterica]EFS4529596.1 DUF550 domain-containing protein [Salmonella enterica]EGG5443872.1 DUF550 domain-containing protein [Salmonella enterica]EJU5711718.1 DUF550 domain-containing protein [Salmonella enterica]
MTTITREQQKQILIDTANHVISRDNTSPYSENLRELARIALASLDAEPVSQPYKLPEEKGASLQLRNLIRKRHAEWSDSTFGNVGPVGPLKHLSKEALEAAAEPGDLSEWADMQFLLWDAQRRAGISDGEITAAMEEKLKVNMARQWPEPKDGEPRLHIKEQPVPVVPAEMPKGLAGQIVSLLAHNIGDKLLAQKIWNACRAAMLQGVEQPQNARQNIPENIPAGKSTLTPDGWISCSERMPDNDESKPIAIFTGKCLGQGMFVATYDDDGFFDYWEGMEIIGVTHWMSLPEPPQQ